MRLFPGFFLVLLAATAAISSTASHYRYQQLTAEQKNKKEETLTPSTEPVSETEEIAPAVVEAISSVVPRVRI